MKGNGLDIQELIEAAVTAAHKAGIKGMDEKILKYAGGVLEFLEQGGEK